MLNQVETTDSVSARDSKVIETLKENLEIVNRIVNDCKDKVLEWMEQCLDLVNDTIRGTRQDLVRAAPALIVLLVLVAQTAGCQSSPHNTNDLGEGIIPDAVADTMNSKDTGPHKPPPDNSEPEPIDGGLDTEPPDTNEEPDTDPLDTNDEPDADPPDAGEEIIDSHIADIPSEDVIPPPEVLNIHIFNVGQGDSSLIIGPSGQSILIDIGDDSIIPNIETLLGADDTLEAVISTHSDKDHIGGIDELGETDLVDGDTLFIAPISDSGDCSTLACENWYTVAETGINMAAWDIGNIDLDGGATITIIAADGRLSPEGEQIDSTDNGRSMQQL